MGRELKRVAIDFEWELSKVWHGYLNPFYKHSYKCDHCDGTGSSPEAKHMKDQWYGYVNFHPSETGSKLFTPDDLAVRKFAERNCKHSPEYYGTGDRVVYNESVRLCRLWNGSWSHHIDADDVTALIEAARLRDLTHTYDVANRWQPKYPLYLPTPEEVNVWSISGFGHDSINCWAVIKAKCKRLGVSDTCQHCEGAGEFWNPPEAEKQAEDWQRIEPPKGDGYQLWETVSEGSPISPVFATTSELAMWLSTHQWGCDKGTTYEQWMNFIEGTGWACSLVATNGEVKTGVQAL